MIFRNTRQKLELKRNGTTIESVLQLIPILFLGTWLAAQEQPALVSKLRAAAVPVKVAVLKEGSLVLSLEYSSASDMNPEAIRRHALQAFREAALSVSGTAAKIAVEIGTAREIYASWTASVRDAADYAGGRLDENQLMSKLEKKSRLSIKDMMTSVMPDEAEIKKELQILEAQKRSEAGKAGGKPAAVAKAGPGKQQASKSDQTGQTGKNSGQKAVEKAKPSPAQESGKEEPGVTSQQDVPARDLFKKGEELLKNRDYWGAADYFRRTLDSFPMESNQALGICYYYAGLMEAALKHFSEAYRLDAKSLLTVLYLATSNDKLGRREEAIRGYEEYLGLNPVDPEMIKFVNQRLQSLKGKN